MTWRGPLMALVVLALVLGGLLFGDRLPAAPRDPAPAIASRVIVHSEPQGLRAISANSGVGQQMVVDGADVWVTYTLSGQTGSSLWITHSTDSGRSFAKAVEASALLGLRRVMHGSLTCLTDDTLVLAGVTVGDQIEPGATGTTALVLLASTDDGATWSARGQSLRATSNQSVSNPLPVALPDGRVVVLFQETRDRTQDGLRLWVPGIDAVGEVLPVDDDESGAPKGAFSAVATATHLHVAYTDGRLAPNSGLLLFTTSAPLDTFGFAPSRCLDPVSDRFWQSEPHLTVDAHGHLLLTATQAVARFQSAAWRDKLQRHKVGGLHEVRAWSREPQVWTSSDAGASWLASGGWDDHTAEIRASSVLGIRAGFATTLVWMESRPITGDPDIRLVHRASASAAPTATAIVNEAAQANGVEPLLALGQAADGAVLILYRDSLPGQPEPQDLILARTAPLAAQSTP